MHVTGEAPGVPGQAWTPWGRILPHRLQLPVSAALTSTRHSPHLPHRLRVSVPILGPPLSGTRALPTLASPHLNWTFCKDCFQIRSLRPWRSGLPACLIRGHKATCDRAKPVSVSATDPLQTLPQRKRATRSPCRGGKGGLGCRGTPAAGGPPC